MSKRCRVLVKIESVNHPVVRKEENGWSGAITLTLVGKSQGFEPTSYRWLFYPDTVEEQALSGRKVKVRLSIGSWERLRYEHDFKMTASDDSGNSAVAKYTVHVSRPEGELIPLYDNPNSRLGAQSRTRSDGTFDEILAYRAVLVKAETEGLLGRINYSWSAEGGALDEVVGSDSAILWMLPKGDPGKTESYEGSNVSVTASDDIGQSVTMKQFIEARVQRRVLLSQTPRRRTGRQPGDRDSGL